MTTSYGEWPGDDIQGEPIRIVPLLSGAGELEPARPLQPGATPHLTYRGGPLLSSVQVFTLFWGAAWQESPLDADVERLNTFFGAILVSPLLDALAEYDVAGYTIGHGSRIGTQIVSTPAPGGTVADADIQSLLQQETASGDLPPPGPNVLYFVYLPSGVTVMSGVGRSCSAYCGYHDAVAGRIFYAVMPYPDCAGCVGTLSAFDALTTTSSHELCEAITDPIPGQGWYDDTNGEIGDICAWQTTTVAGYAVQQEWSNARGSCDGSGS